MFLAKSFYSISVIVVYFIGNPIDFLEK